MTEVDREQAPALPTASARDGMHPQHAAATITSSDLARAQKAEATIERMQRTNRMVNGCARDARLRAERAEAAIERVRKALAEFDGRGILGDPRCWPLPTAGDVLAVIRAALDEPQEPPASTPRPPGHELVYDSMWSDDANSYAACICGYEVEGDPHTNHAENDIEAHVSDMAKEANQ